MRLIDLDKVRWKEGFYDMHTSEQYPSMIFNTEEWLEWATAEAKVEAIPVEWINKWLSKFFQEINGRTFYMGEGYDSVQDMLADWEKENDKAE